MHSRRCAKTPRAQDPSMMQGGMPSAAQMQQQQEKAEKAKEMRDELLKKVLSPEAAERLNRIKIVKSDKAERLENMILQMAQQGQVQSQITDSYLKQMLEGISEGGVRLIACAALLTHACTRIALSACASLPVR